MKADHQEITDATIAALLKSAEGDSNIPEEIHGLIAKAGNVRTYFATVTTEILRRILAAKGHERQSLTRANHRLAAMNRQLRRS